MTAECIGAAQVDPGSEDFGVLCAEYGVAVAAKIKIKAELRALRQLAVAGSGPASPGAQSTRIPLAGASAGAWLELAPGRPIGSGGSGVVFRAFRFSKSGRRGEAVATKTLAVGASVAEVAQFRAEVELLRKAAAGCRGVCRLLEEPVEHEGRIYMVLTSRCLSPPAA
jgi:hypothetical protein